MPMSESELMLDLLAGVNSICYKPVTIVKGGNKLFSGENEIYKKCVEN